MQKCHIGQRWAAAGSARAARDLVGHSVSGILWPAIPPRDVGLALTKQAPWRIAGLVRNRLSNALYSYQVIIDFEYALSISSVPRNDITHLEFELSHRAVFIASASAFDISIAKFA